MEVQNSNLNTRAWDFLNCSQKGEEKILMIGIISQFEEDLKTQDYFLNLTIFNVCTRKRFTDWRMIDELLLSDHRIIELRRDRGATLPSLTQKS